MDFELTEEDLESEYKLEVGQKYRTYSGCVMEVIKGNCFLPEDSSRQPLFLGKLTHETEGCYHEYYDASGAPYYDASMALQEKL